MNKEQKKDFETWHEFFDFLCHSAGYCDNAELASRYCLKSGKRDKENFDAMQKNLRNWRLGRHRPLRRNVILLAELLDVDKDPTLQCTWDALYSASRAEGARGGIEADIPKPDLAAHGSLFRSGWHLPLSALALVVNAGGAFAWQSITERHAFEQLPMIGYDARVVMSVGESRLIHGDRTDCSGPPPDWYYLRAQVPPSALGEFSDGGVARKMDNSCNAVVRARAVRFTAKTAGSEELDLLGDYMKIVVTDRAPPHVE